MKILMTADTIGGVWAYSIQLARQLRKWDVEIILATMGRLPSFEQTREAAECGNVQLCSSEFALEWMQHPWADVDRAAMWLLELEEKHQPDVIHLNGYAHGSLPWHAPKLTVCHSCVLSWWLAVHGCAAPQDEWNTYRDRVQQGLQSADYVLAPTSAMLASIRAIYGELSCPCAVISNAVDSAAYETPATKGSFIFAAGRIWDPAKNIAALERACVRVAWPIFLAGSRNSPDSKQLENGCSPNVTYMGEMTPAQVARLLRAAPIYCLPACYEPFGLSVLEAAWAKCALVLGDIPSLRENWDGAAVFVAPDDVDGLADALNQFITTPAIRETYAQLAHERAQQFSPDSTAGSYMNVYHALNLSRMCSAIPVLENTPCAS
jgi:glycogen synthase